MRIHILGAAGSGTTTLGRALAEECALAFHDTDDFFWLPSDPPYSAKRPVPERKRLLRAQLEQNERWVLSGSLVSWSDEVEHFFTHIIFMSLPHDSRMARLRTRERRRHGDRIQPGGDMYRHNQAFLAYAAAYESGRMDMRTRAVHEKWLQRFDCPILKLDSIDLCVIWWIELYSGLTLNRLRTQSCNKYTGRDRFRLFLLSQR